MFYIVWRGAGKVQCDISTQRWSLFPWQQYLENIIEVGDSEKFKVIQNCIFVVVIRNSVNFAVLKMMDTFEYEPI